MWLGDFPATFTAVPIFFTTHTGATGAPVAPSSAFEVADVKLYKDGSATERASNAGWTMTSPFDSITGLHRLLLDLTDNTDAGFYAAGHVYTAVLSPDETVDAQAVATVLGQFGINLAGIPYADAWLDRDMSTGTDSGSTTVRTPRQALRALRNKTEISAGSLNVYKENDSTTSWTAAVTTSAGNPISSIDPAGP